jgi:LysM repeat protein
MDNNDSNIKSQQTGGLKLMTVFIAVLALHVVVIGGFTVYHLMSGGSTDADLTSTDKNHKGLKNADGSAMADATLPDASQGDKSAPTATLPTEVATIPANPTTPAPDMTASTVPATPAPAPAPLITPAPAPAPAVLAPAPAVTLTTPKPTTLTPPTEMVDQGSQTPTGPISTELAPPADPAPTPSAPMAAGPVHMPPADTATAKIGHEHAQTYVVKITDSYKKIAHAHHITVAQLKEANHIKGDTLHTGQKLFIPSGKTAVAENTPTSTTTLDAAPIVRTQNEPAPTSTAILASSPSIVTTPSLHSHLYTVVKGDTLIKIAHKFKTTATAIMSENSITDPSKLTIGKKLKIPSKESRSAKNSTPALTQPSQVQAKQQYEPTPASGQLANFVP